MLDCDNECLTKGKINLSVIYIINTVRDSLPYRAPLYPPCEGHMILRPCAFGSLKCVVLCVWAKSLLVPLPFTLLMLTS